ncbi:hypothetical protein [Shewanella gelidii]|uniref:Uncharacterized protein n=1 Tax=Shewanella gelidii TaxID=1642821 RepID=A0A917JXT0_9GAMM|nr:hypothetical protein [Shewanella gelidii]MCL1099704.1 hypothetical protein [Shewanella gelidii]GGI89255.1 hypothetical protein GCM10009332_28310 [Shewanella gelidii]
MKSTIITTLIILLLSGCTSMQPLSEGMPKSQFGNDLKVGDYISIVTNDGETFEFEISLVDSEEVHGEGVAIKISDITEIKKREFSLSKSSGLVATIWVGLSIIVLGYLGVVF